MNETAKIIPTAMRILSATKKQNETFETEQNRSVYFSLSLALCRRYIDISFDYQRLLWRNWQKWNGWCDLVKKIFETFLCIRNGYFQFIGWKIRIKKIDVKRKSKYLDVQVRQKPLLYSQNFQFLSISIFYTFIRNRRFFSINFSFIYGQNNRWTKMNHWNRA